MLTRRSFIKTLGAGAAAAAAPSVIVSEFLEPRSAPTREFVTFDYSHRVPRLATDDDAHVLTAAMLREHMNRQYEWLIDAGFIQRQQAEAFKRDMVVQLDHGSLNVFRGVSARLEFRA